MKDIQTYQFYLLHISLIIFFGNIDVGYIVQIHANNIFLDAPSIVRKYKFYVDVPTDI